MRPILEGLNKEQREAVTTTKGPLLIIAGAGTGKTTVITRRIAYLIEKKLAKPAEILALTFTDKAAAEMEERVDVLVPYGYVDTWISTFHAFGNRILQESALDIGLPTDFSVLTHPQQVLFFQQNLFSFDLDYYRPLSNPTKFISAILAFISRCKDEDISPEQYQRYVQKLKAQNSKRSLKSAAFADAKVKTREEAEEAKLELKRQEELVGVYSRYEELKKAAGKLDYGDLITLTLELFRRRPKILKNYQEKFKYILVDEYQDTNFAQNELVKMVASSHKNICVVGDDDQSIYKFRGAAISNILKFKKDHPKAKQIVLVQNYRSNQAILDTSYKLIRNNDPDRLEVQNKINKKLVAASNKAGKGPIEICAETLSEEADLVADEIKRLVKEERLTYKDIAILVRANSQADAFLSTLNLRGIPYKFVGSSGLYNQPEIKLLISFLTAAANFDDSINLYNLAVSEVYSLPIADCIACMDWAKRRNRTLSFVFKNVEEVKEIEISAEGKAVIEKINLDLEKALESSKRENVGRVLYDWLQNTGYLSRLERQGDARAETKVQNIAKFFDKIAEFIDLAQNESTRQFVDYLETMRAVGDDPATAEFDPDLAAVNVMTIHAAKGLEFTSVFVVGLVADRFPSRERADPIQLPEELIKESLPSGDYHLQEERRLFYVGSTRAKNFLYYSWSRDAGGKRLRKVSPFVLEALERPAGEVITSKPTPPREKIEQFGLTQTEKVKLPNAEGRIIRLTQASIDDYETCAYKYRYSHVLKLPILRHHGVVYGFALHVAVAEFYRQKMVGKILPLDSCLQVLENAWVAEGFLTAEHEEKRLIQAKEVIKAFWKREAKSKQTPTYIEKPFRFNLEEADTKILVSGRFDRVDINEGKVSIIDFKSTENRSEEQLVKDAKESIQLKVYTLGYYKNYKVVPEFVGIYDLETGLIGGYYPKQEDIKETEERVAEAARNIRSNLQKDEFPANPKYFGRLPACYYCAYSSICPFSQVK